MVLLSRTSQVTHSGSLITTKLSVPPNKMMVYVLRCDVAQQCQLTTKGFLKHSLNFCISSVFDWQQLVDQHRSEDHALGGTGLGVTIRLSSTSLN